MHDDRALVSLGLSGAWIGNLTVLEAYRPLFPVLPVIALVLAARRIFWGAEVCHADGSCVAPSLRRLQKLIFAMVAVLAFIGFLFPYFVRLFYQAPASKGLITKRTLVWLLC